jgi:hypothetical protein
MPVLLQLQNVSSYDHRQGEATESTKEITQF